MVDLLLQPAAASTGALANSWPNLWEEMQNPSVQVILSAAGPLRSSHERGVLVVFQIVSREATWYLCSVDSAMP